MVQEETHSVVVGKNERAVLMEKSADHVRQPANGVAPSDKTQPLIIYDIWGGAFDTVE